MLKKEIKREFNDNIQSQCNGCLSIGRKLTQIGKYNDLYCKIIADTLYGIDFPAEDIQLCWECVSLLQKISKFQQQVQKANEMCRIGQNYIYGTLSSLTTIIIHDTHPNIIYVNDANMQCDIIKQNINQNDESNDSISNNDDTVFNDEESELKLNVKIEPIGKSDVKVQESEKANEINLINDQKSVIKKGKYKNKWAERRALLNKKPKFKILTNQELVIDKYFRKAVMDMGTVKICIKRDRDGDRFSKRRFKCESCVVAFNNERLLMKHYDVIHKKASGNYICDICNRRMQQKSHLERHMKRHFVRYQCSLCEFSCRSKKERITHMINAHKKVFQCLKCELSFSCKQEFLKHYKNWHENFICDHCGVSFKMRYCIKDHIKKQHSPFECAPCNKRFSRYNGLWFHNKVCHGPQGAPRNAAYCVECDKRFSDVYRYKWHLHNSVKHTPKKKKRIPCPDCEKVFSKNIYMKDHHNLVHLKNFKYRCEECDKNFVRNADLVKHRRRIHEGVLPPRNKICYVCGRGFTTNEILTHHLRTHSGERPHRCGACPAAFAQPAALAAHARTTHPNHNPNPNPRRHT